MAIALTNTEVGVLKALDRVCQRADERGLHIEVHPGGPKLWRLKYRHPGRDKGIALGRYPQVKLAEARRKRDAAR